MTDFNEECRKNASQMHANQSVRAITQEWIDQTAAYKYVYNFRWLGRPIIQFPQDVFAMQEIIWRVRPDMVIETGVAHGGSLVFYASMLELIGGPGEVVGIDIEIRPANRTAIEDHPMFGRIHLIERSSVDPLTVQRVHALTAGKQRVLVVLDSNHTHDHVLEELRLYSPLVTKDSYLVVFDTIIEHMPAHAFPDRPWGKGNNPMTAVCAFLEKTDRFIVDKEIEEKLLITVAPNGYLRCVRD